VKPARQSATMTVTSEKLAEGKTKILRAGSAPEEVVVTFKNDATAFNGKKTCRNPR